MDSKKSFWKIAVGIVGMVLSILLLVAITGDLNLLVEDYESLTAEGQPIWNLLRLDFNTTNNPAGPFGVFFGYWFIFIFGRFFGLSFLLSITLLSFFEAFMKGEKRFLVKLSNFIIFALFFNILLFIINPATHNFAGLIPWKIFYFFQKLFSTTGTAIISCAAILITILVIVEVENVVKFFQIIWLIISGFFTSLYKIISAIFKFIISLFKRSAPKPAKVKKPKKEKKPTKPKSTKEKAPKKKPAKEKKKKDSTPETKEEDDNVIGHSPRIIDHVAGKGKPKEYAPIIPKRNLSQNSGDMPDEPLRDYEKPSIDEFLSTEDTSDRDRSEIEKEIKLTSRILEEKLAEFGVEAKVINVNIGPIITQYELEPAPGVKVSKFHSLSDDLALAIKATSIRVQAPIPGRGLVGIELPNRERDTIFLKDILLSPQMKKLDTTLAIGLGKDISGNPVVADLAKMPHLLIAGSTGSGKSVCVNTIITSLLLRTTPDECRLLMIDPKRVELSGYEGIPHLIQNVVTDTEYALASLDWAVGEMEKRYETLQKFKVKNIDSYNKLIKKMREKDPELEERIIPYIVIIVDEFADLMMTAGKDVERPITRLAQMARAIGIHLILATQRPSIKVITGVIKSNFPSRIAFKVSSKVDSRVIIDANGADKLLGMGDMLFLPPGKGSPDRIHGAFIPSEEIHNIVEYLKVQPKPEFEIVLSNADDGVIGEFEYDDELFPEAATAVVMAGSASVSMLQRHFKVGYARAGRLVDMLEQAGIVGPHVGSKSRDVLATEEDLKIYGYIKE